MKRMTYFPKTSDILHIEVPGAIVNIHVGLSDRNGVPVTNVSITADGYVGEEWHLPDFFENPRFVGVRVMKGKAPTATSDKGAIYDLIEAASDGAWHSVEDCEVEGRLEDCHLCKAIARVKEELK
jgi:hypothetical protein